MKVLLFLAILLATISCVPNTTYSLEYREVVVEEDREACRQYTLDLLEASSNRHYTDKTKRRYDLSSARDIANWEYQTTVECVKAEYNKGGCVIYSTTTPWNELDSLQMSMYNRMKSEHLISIKVKHKKLLP